MTVKRGPLLELCYLAGGVVTYQPGDTLGPRLLSDFELVLIIEGHVTYQRNEQPFDAPPGAVILAPPESREVYTWDPRHETRHAFFHFDMDAIPTDWPAIARWPVVLQKPDPVIEPLFHHVIRGCASHPTWRREPPGRDVCRIVESLLSVFLANRGGSPWSKQTARPESVLRALQKMKAVLEKPWGNGLALGELAAAAHVSPKHLCRLFQQELGCSPMRAWRFLRLQMALILLARSNLSIKQVGARCGFSDEFHFSHCFSQTLGRPPSVVREQMRRGESPPALPLPPDLLPRFHW